MAIRGVLIDIDALTAAPGEIAAVIGVIAGGEPPLAVGLVVRSPGDGPRTPQVAFSLPLDRLGLDPTDPRVLAMAAAGAGCHLRDLVVVSDGRSGLHQAVDATGARVVFVGEHGGSGTHGDPTPDGAGRSAPTLDQVAAALEAIREADARAAGEVGVGPHRAPWPDDPRLDPVLLAGGDRRNVVDRFRYWREGAIVAELDRSRLPVHVAVENWQHDLNIGTVVRNANAFNVAGVHIVGKRRWNRRGAMATDRYLTVTHHPSAETFTAWAVDAGLAVVGIDNVAGAVPLEAAPLTDPCVLVFGQEGPGLSDEMQAACAEIREITQYGSTRSLNAGVASGIALHWWAQTCRSATAGAATSVAAWPRGRSVL